MTTQRVLRFCHEVLNIYYRSAKKSFHKSLNHLEVVQREKLKTILVSLKNTTEWKIFYNKNYEELRDLIPVSSYSDFSQKIQEQRQLKNKILSADVQRYEPTSGSTEARKWIPYSQNFLNEINQAARVWLADLYERFSDIKKGTHYWSLSWLPEDLRGLTSSDDVELFPFYQRWILKKTMAVPSQISQVSSSEAAWWATLLYLTAQKNLSLVSVWSPTFWIKITSDIKQNWPKISKALEQGQWESSLDHELNLILGSPPRRCVQNLNPTDLNFFKNLWPNLKLISAWDSSSSARWAQILKDEFSHVNFQGKGLWATEGVVTIPLFEKKLLAFQSHFFEFKNLKTQKILPAWQLELGGEYQPILWTSSGLLRYALQDCIKVTSFVQSVPCFEFQGRLQSVDLVGEKIDAVWVQQLFELHPEWKAITLMACHKPEPHYHLCHQSSIRIDIESELLNLHHYKLARDLGQLQVATTSVVQNIFSFFSQVRQSQIVGENKIETLIEVESYDEFL